MRRLLVRLLDVLAAAPPPAELTWELARNDGRADRQRLPRATVHRARPWLVLVVALAACSKSSEPVKVDPNAPPVRVDGSSTVFPFSKAVADELREKDGVKATVNESGTTGGFKKFCRGETDISGASRPIEQNEIDECTKAGITFYELPISYDGLAVVVNAANDWADKLTVEELRRIWDPDAEKTITSWKQVRDGFPDRPLHLFGPGGESGTFDYFTQAIVGTQRASRKDYTASEDDSVLVRDVSDDADALGYFGYAYVRNQPKLKVVPIDDGNPANGDGPIAPSNITVTNGTYQPLSRPLFIYVNATTAKRSEVDRFVTFYLQAARELGSQVGYVPLPLRADQLAAERYKARRAGTLFGGATPRVGVTMEQLLEAQTAAP